MIRSMAITIALLAFSLGTGSAGAAEPAPDASAAFFAKNASAPGVTTLPGLQYKIVKSGPATGAHPLRSDDVVVRYEGRFLDGKVFNTSPGGGSETTTFPLQKLIPGWIAALQMMRPGDIWMLYLPPHLAYGSAGKAYIPPDSTLIFKVELVSSGPHVDAPPAAAK